MSQYKLPGHAVSTYAAGSGHWWWACDCGKRSRRVTQSPGVAKRGAATHMASERRKARYTATGAIELSAER